MTFLVQARYRGGVDFYHFEREAKDERSITPTIDSRVLSRPADKHGVPKWAWRGGGDVMIFIKRLSRGQILVHTKLLSG